MQLTRSSAIRIIIAEANQLNCQLVQSAFRSRTSRVEVVATAVAYDGLVGLLHEHKPDIVIVSVRLQDGPLEGYHVLRDLHLLHSNTRAIMLLDSRERELVVDAFRCGAHGIVFRDEPLETLGKCVQAVYQGQVWANSLHLTYVLEALTQTMPVRLQDARGYDLLSRRQEDVVRLVSEGMTNREISQQLGLSEHTVRNYLFRVFDKLGVSTRVELVLYCLQNKQRSLPTDNGTASFGPMISSRSQIAMGGSKRQSGD